MILYFVTLKTYLGPSDSEIQIIVIAFRLILTSGPINV